MVFILYVYIYSAVHIMHFRLRGLQAVPVCLTLRSRIKNQLSEASVVSEKL